MRTSVAGVLCFVVAVSVSGCGGLSEASSQACSAGKASAAQANEFVQNGPPEIMVELAKTKGPEFGELAEKADDEGVSSALTDLSETFNGFRPDMSKVPTALQRYPEFDRYIEEFKTAVREQADELDAACS